ncbi:hypothetical protein BH11PSE7_BH11PSE7_19110 [soil metagenome]
MSAGDAGRGGAGSGADRQGGGPEPAPGADGFGPGFESGFEPDAERDAWLCEALRHAPDADVSAPPALKLRILREARSTAGLPLAAPVPVQQRSASGWHRIAAGAAALWAALARPPVAAGFASVMVATLVGLLWWDRPMDEALPRPPLRAEAPAVREVTPAPSALAPESSPEPLPESSPLPPAEPATADPSPAKERRRGATDAAARKSAPAAPRLESKATEREDRPSPKEWRSDPSAALSRAPMPMPAAPSLADAPALSARTPAATPAPPPAAAAAPMQDMQAAPTAPALQQAPPMPSAKAVAAAPATSAETARPASRAELSPRIAVPASAPLAGNFLASGNPMASGLVSNNPMADLLLSILERPQRWTWQSNPGDGTPQPMSNALLRWLMSLDGTAAGLRAAPGRSAPAPSADEPAPMPTMVLRLASDGQPGATIELGPDHIDTDITPTVTRSAAPPPRRTALPPAGMNALKSSLAAATR